MEDCELVQTCGVCEEICDQKDIKTHGCLEGYNSYTVDPNTLYFYPLAGMCFSVCLYVVAEKRLFYFLYI